MRISIELFLLDNFVMNLLAVRLGEALRGEKGRRQKLCALLGALWSLGALALCPALLELWGRALCLGLMTLLTSRRGRYPLTLLTLLCAYALLGGGLLLLQIGLGLPIQSSGVLISTVPVRLALYTMAAGWGLIPLVRHFIRRGYEEAQEGEVLLKLGEKTLVRRAFFDSGNLLREPVTGLPVVLAEGVEIEEGLPLYVEGWGEVLIGRGEMYLLEAAAGPVEVYVGKAPMKLDKGKAIVPCWAVPKGKKERREFNEGNQKTMVQAGEKMQKATVPPVSQAGSQAAKSPVVPAHGGEFACPSDGGGGEPLCPAVPDPGVGTEQAH